MSLKIAAEHLKSQGRGPDTELVHMTKGEIKGLRQLAQAHGGDLTINPQTGLPEAGFLESILPMVAGAAMVALAPETGGLSLLADPMIAGLTVGAADWAITGNLQQGLMAGLGAYGGAGLATGLAGVGAEAGIESAAKTQVANLGGEAGKDMTSFAFNTENFANLKPEQLTDYATRFSGAASDEARNAILQSASQANAAWAPNAAGTLAGNAAPSGANMLSGLKALGSSGTQAGAFLGNNVMNLATAAAPVVAAGNTFGNSSIPGAQPQQTNPMGLKTLSPNFKGSFPTQPSPHYQAQYPNYVTNPYNPYAPKSMAEGGITQTQDKNFAAGGMYPMSQIDHTQYASSPQTPISMQATLAGYDPETNPLTGEPTTHMAGGGAVAFSGQDNISLVDAANAANKYNTITRQSMRSPATLEKGDAGIYTDTDPNTASLDAYNAALYKMKKNAKKAGLSKNVVLKEATPLSDIEFDAQGGTVGMADGGSTDHVYKPQYQNYQQTPYAIAATRTPAELQAATAAYNAQTMPTPTRVAAPNPSTGYAINPMQMNGSPAWQAEQARLASEQAAAEAERQDTMFRPYFSDGSSNTGGASGGLPQDFKHYAMGGGVSGLGGYSDGGRLLKGPGDGMSDNIPAVIGHKQPARLADGEFVVPADVVSHLGNGSTEAGAKQLYAMMDKIRAARTGKKKQAPAVKAGKYLPK